MVCDFYKVQVFNYDKKHPYKPFKITELRRHLRIFSRLAGFDADSEARTEIELNTDASYKMAKLHDALKENGYSGHELEVYLVRLLFSLFADDTGVFEKSTFYNYIKASSSDGNDLGGRLSMLFHTLNTPPEKRMTTLPEELRRFRYINGSLFAERLSMPFFSSKMRSILLECCDFDWTQISPAIFGAMFQGVMNPQERRELGAHYTSEENILKVIRPLFLDELQEEFERSKSTITELQAFHRKLASLTFLDPACGCGNFLIVTYQKLRQLEFEVLKLLSESGQMVLFDDPTKVTVDQFYGIEFEEFPCEIAKVSMLLTKHLMDQEISHYFGGNFIDYPIRDNASIINANALRLDWNEVIPAYRLNYIMGNPAGNYGLIA
ncbi:MAG: class I SAM-dependent DNA methyltransferase [Smithella sp.]|nr:class I SAM-dependent DNA methyltransferase [Smithella sp.]